MLCPHNGEIHFHAPGLKRYETTEFVQREPNAFVPISLTGSACALNCRHCAGQLLRWMRSPAPDQSLLELCRSLAQGGTRGVLISGGADRRGRVPFRQVANDLKRLKPELGLRVAVHTGIVDEPTADLLREAEIDAALVDVVGADETAREVLHLSAGAAVFERSLALLEAAGVPVMPHVVMGLHYGRFLGEERAIEWIAQHSPQAVVLVAFTPIAGTPMAHTAPPSTPEVVVFMAAARERLGTVPLWLGCARPAGPARIAMDRAAVDLGFAGVAYPSDGLAAYARARGRTPLFHEVCCGMETMTNDR